MGSPATAPPARRRACASCWAPCREARANPPSPRTFPDVDIESVCLIGGTGFVGRSIAEQACAQGRRVRVITRSEPRARPLLVLPTLETMVADPNDEQSLERCFENMDAVVNLAGILHERRGATFESVHAELPRRIARACRA